MDSVPKECQKATSGLLTLVAKGHIVRLNHRAEGEMHANRPRSAEQPKFVLRLPQELKDWVFMEASRNGSSQNSEIVRALRERKDRCEQKLAA